MSQDHPALLDGVRLSFTVLAFGACQKYLLQAKRFLVDLI